MSRNGDANPKQTVLGIGLAGGQGVSVGLILAIFVSNLPEAIGSATDMRAAGTPVRQIRLLWFAVAGLCALAHAAEKSGRVPGLATTLGFAVAAGLST
jgi:zinc transporter, ZIP family